MMQTKLLIKLLEDYEQVEIKNLRDFKEYLIQSEITKFQPISVVHCPQSYGIVIEHSSGVKISYSGDTRPS